MKTLKSSDRSGRVQIASDTATIATGNGQIQSSELALSTSDSARAGQIVLKSGTADISRGSDILLGGGKVLVTMRILD